MAVGAHRRRASVIAHLDDVTNLLLCMLLRVSRFVLEHIGCLVIALLLLDHVVATVAVQFCGLLGAAVDSLRFVSSVLCGRHIKLLLSWVDLVICDDSSDDFAHIVFLHHTGQQGIDPVKLRIRRIVIPAHCRHGIFRLEQVSHWRIIYNNDILHRASEACQILHICVIEESAVLSEQKVRAHFLRVQMRHERLCILGKTCREDDELIKLVHSLEELIDEGANQDVDCANLAVNLYREHDISVINRFE